MFVKQYYVNQYHYGLQKLLLQVQLAICLISNAVLLIVR